METVFDWAAAHGIAILAVIVAALILTRVLRRVIPTGVGRAMLRQSTPRTAPEQRKRAKTVSDVLVGSAQVGVLIVALLLVVDELGVNVAPVIAGLGIGGIAIGLGAQALVRDMVNGMLIVAEDQYGVGDTVSIAGVQGVVEEVNFRRTVLRDLDGTLHSVPNGEVKVASNLTRGYSGINLVIPLAAVADAERAWTLADEVGRALAEDAELGGRIVDAPHVLRLEGLTGAGVNLRIIGRATPGAQWTVSTALQQRLGRAFEEAGIRFGAPPPPAPPAPPPSRP